MHIPDYPQNVQLRNATTTTTTIHGPAIKCLIAGSTRGQKLNDCHHHHRHFFFSFASVTLGEQLSRRNTWSSAAHPQTPPSALTGDSCSPGGCAVRSVLLLHRGIWGGSTRWNLLCTCWFSWLCPVLRRKMTICSGLDS